MQKQIKIKLNHTKSKRLLVWIATNIAQRLFAILFAYMAISVAVSTGVGELLIAIPFAMLLLLTNHNIIWEETRIHNCFLNSKPKKVRAKWSKTKTAFILGTALFVVVLSLGSLIEILL